MPTYQYACRACGHRFDAVQGFHEDALQHCPECEQGELRKLFGNVGVVFKGSGFYRNDSRAGAKSGGSSSSSASGSGSKQASDKPAPKQAKGGSNTGAATKAASKSAAPSPAPAPSS